MPSARALDTLQTLFFHFYMKIDTTHICFRLHTIVPLHQRKGRRGDNAGNHTSFTFSASHTLIIILYLTIKFLKKGKHIMAVNYKLYQAKRSDKFNGKWYGRVLHNGTIGTKQLATIMQRNCTVKESDIVAVLTELVEVMNDQLQNSMIVKLDGFGTFRMGMNSAPADSAKDWTVLKNVRGLHVNFIPQGSRNAANGNFERTFLKNVKIQEAADYTKPEKVQDQQ